MSPSSQHVNFPQYEIIALLGTRRWIDIRTKIPECTRRGDTEGGRLKQFLYYKELSYITGKKKEDVSSSLLAVSISEHNVL